MSVYTQLTKDQFAAFCHAYGIDFANAIPITQGIKNSNWFIQTTDDKEGQYSYVFTLFEERPPEDIEKMAAVLNQLKGALPIAAPLAKTQTHPDGSPDYLIHYKNKAITVVPCLAGSHPTQPTVMMSRIMGEALAKLHITLQSLSPSEDYGVPLYPWHMVRDREIKFMPADEAKLMRTIWQNYNSLPLDSLPKGLCHLDMFADNTLWDLTDGHEKLTGLLDFTEVGVEHYVMDIAITINDFCTIWGDAEDGESVDFDNQKKQAFLEGYQSVRPLHKSENNALPVMLAMAAVIFWLLRLNVIYYNRKEGRTGDNIMVKNPDLMKRLASYHWGHVEALQGQQQTIYVLQLGSNQRANQENTLAARIMGVFESEVQAQQAIKQLIQQAEYKDTADRFIIDAFALGDIKM